VDLDVGQALISAARRWKATVLGVPFWTVVVLMGSITLLHYLTPQVRPLFPSVNAFLSRHAVERIVFVLPVAYAASAFRMRGGLITLGLSVLAMLPRIIWISQQPFDALFETLAAAVVGCLVVWLIESQARQKELHQFYARRITQAQEEERQRIARELHDETLQMLIVLSRRLEALAATPQLTSETARQKLSSLRELVVHAVRDARRFVRDLRPPALDHLGLVAAIRGLVNDLGDGGGITAQLEVQGPARRLLPEEELTLFRIAQEALNNVRWHSGASRATVRLVFTPDRVQMAVEDNGKGFKAPDGIGDLVAAGKLGLVGMGERARTLGGTLSVRSLQGQGTSIRVDLPVQPELDRERSGSRA
jgi:two-component system sensor histidine kinase DegS